jgi:tetratricopeptide (TPR) repeat protein
MLQKLIDQAIRASLQQDWEQAIELNEHILQRNPNDIATLNRLAKAYVQKNQVDQAKNLYQKVLTLDRYNPIATKCIQKLEHAASRPAADCPDYLINLIDEPGKTAVLPLTRLANHDIISQLRTGQKLKLIPKNRYLAAYTELDVYVGNIPDQNSAPLLSFINQGNQYEAAIKTMSASSVTIFIREIHRCDDLSNTPSFSN